LREEVPACSFVSFLLLSCAVLWVDKFGKLRARRRGGFGGRDMEAFVSTVGIGNGRDTRRMRCRRRGVVAMAKPVAEFDKVWLKLERAPDQTSSGLMLKTEEEIKQNIGVVRKKKKCPFLPFLQVQSTWPTNFFLVRFWIRRFSVGCLCGAWRPT